MRESLGRGAEGGRVGGRYHEVSSVEADLLF